MTLTYPEGMISWLCQHTSSYSLPETGGDDISSWIYRLYTRFVEIWAKLVKALGLKGVLG